jgi:hypothetical protein
MNIKTPGIRNSENYECSDISYGHYFSLSLSSSYLHTAGVEVLSLHLITLNDTHGRINTVGHLRTSYQPDADTSMWQHTTITDRQISMPPAGFEPTIPTSERDKDQRSKPSGDWDRLERQFCVKIWTKTPPDGCGKCLSQMQTIHSQMQPPESWSNIAQGRDRPAYARKWTRCVTKKPRRLYWRLFILKLCL